MRYVIRWNCEGCGKDGVIIGEDHYDAHRTFDPLKSEHEEHSTKQGELFSKIEGYEEVEEQE